MNIYLLFLSFFFLTGGCAGTATEDNEHSKSTSCTFYGNSSGVHNITLPNFETFPTLCNAEIAGPGWIVIQQRINGSVDFERNWDAYKNGFGAFTTDFFLGLEKIHRLTNDKPQELYIYMERYNGNSFYARYDNFKIAGEEDKYRLLSLGTYSGNADWDRMRPNEHSKFSTFDNNNDDNHTIDCPEHRHAGWWFTNCSDCNPNGKYYPYEFNATFSNWWIPYYSLKIIKMMIRARGN